VNRQERLADLLSRLDLPVASTALPHLLWFVDEMLRWNRRLNLTSITDPAEVLEKHLVDSLTVLPALGGRERLLDIGSGAGFPGIPLALALTDLSVVSVDAVEKKIGFQRHVKRHLQLQRFSPLAARVEDLACEKELVGSFDVVVSRAFSSLTDFARLARPFVRAAGFLLAMKGAEGEREMSAADGDIREASLQCTDIRRLRLPVSGAERTLIIMRPL